VRLPTSCTVVALLGAACGRTPAPEAMTSVDMVDGTSTGDGTGDDEASSSTTSAAAPDGSMTDDVWEIRANAVAVPAEETSYLCFGATMPLDGLAHVTALEPVIDDATVVHHMLLRRVAEPVGQAEPCYPEPAGSTLLWGWGPGAGAMVLPPEAGLLVGERPAEHLALQIHYNNPLLSGGRVDDSGIAIHYTSQLRPEHAAVVGLGDVAGLVIPPGQPQWPTVHVCPAATTAALSQPLHVFASWLHAHELGTVLWTDHRRDGATVGELGRADPYDFGAQTLQPLDAVIEPGDELWTHCWYDSTSRAEVTYGGGASTDEMCLNYLWVWPRPTVLYYCNAQ
jgi:hypothetical protein